MVKDVYNINMLLDKPFSHEAWEVQKWSLFGEHVAPLCEPSPHLRSQEGAKKKSCLISDFTSEVISEVRQPTGTISRVGVTYLLRSNRSTTKFHDPSPKNVLRRSIRTSLRRSSPKWCLNVALQRSLRTWIRRLISKMISDVILMGERSIPAFSRFRVIWSQELQ